MKSPGVFFADVFFLARQTLPKRKAVRDLHIEGKYNFN